MKSIILVCLVGLSLNVWANCETPTIDTIRELSNELKLDWGWFGKDVCTFNPITKRPHTCLQVNELENKQADLCD